MISVNEENFAEIVHQAKVPVMLDVYGLACPPCQWIMPLIEQFSEEFKGRAVVGKLEVEEQPGLAGRLGINAVPTFIFFQNGAETGRLVGIPSREKLLAELGLPNSAV